jgi:hypothetical protein
MSIFASLPWDDTLAAPMVLFNNTGADFTAFVAFSFAATTFVAFSFTATAGCLALKLVAKIQKAEMTRSIIPLPVSQSELGNCYNIPNLT